ncbi:MAG: hypothetical protein MJK08_06445 [Campylobacterales bacterium]|nr:hypothetical protein [Campylobacterales bacterium]
MKNLHPRHYFYFLIIIAIIMFLPSFSRPLVEIGMIKEEDFNYYEILIINVILPLSMIIATCLNVEIDIVKNKNKRLDYKFSYFVFIPFIIIIFLYAYSKSNF